MKGPLSILLLLIFLVPQLTKVWIVVDFKINQDFIAKVLCINKDKPADKCNGKCYLSKQLKKAENKEQTKIPNSLHVKLETKLFTQNLSRFLQQSIYEIFNKSSFIDISDLYTSSFINDIFHPPELIIV